MKEIVVFAVGAIIGGVVGGMLWAHRTELEQAENRLEQRMMVKERLLRQDVERELHQHEH